MLHYLKTLIYFFSILMSEFDHDLIVKGFWEGPKMVSHLKVKIFIRRVFAAFKSTLIIIGRQSLK